ncbi:retrovirus-related pol polyprotein from transposon TNT 1-94 [Tanacetum coccineum]
MAEIGCNWARIGPSKSSQSLSNAHKWAVNKSRRKQRKDSGPTEPVTDEAQVSTPSYDPPQSGEDSMQLSELINLCTSLKEKVLDLEKAKTTQAKEIASLNKRVKQLEKRRKLRTLGIKILRKVGSTSRVESSNDEIKFEKVVKEPVVSVATTTKLIPISAADPVTTAGEVVNNASASVEILDELTLAQTLIEIKTTKPKPVTTTVTTVTSVRPRAKGIIFHDQEEQVPVMDISQKDKKRSKTDKTEHGNGKSVKRRSRSTLRVRMIHPIHTRSSLLLEADNLDTSMTHWRSGAKLLVDLTWRAIKGQDHRIYGGSGPKWLFDIDALTKSMNYKLVVAGNQSNGNADTKACDDTCKARMEIVPGKDYILLPLWTVDLPFSQSSKSSLDAGFKPSGDDEKSMMMKMLVAEAGPKTIWMLLCWYNNENGLFYDEVFAPVARIEAIRLFLAYASFKDFVVYQMDVKSAFLYGKIEEEVYVCQPPRFKDPDFPNRVYKVEKALYGLHQAPRACVCDDSNIFGFTKKVLALSLRKMLPPFKKFKLSSMAFTDSDYARVKMDRKSTTGGWQFLG